MIEPRIVPAPDCHVRLAALLGAVRMTIAALDAAPSPNRVGKDNWDGLDWHSCQALKKGLTEAADGAARPMLSLTRGDS